MLKNIYVLTCLAHRFVPVNSFILGIKQCLFVKLDVIQKNVKYLSFFIIPKLLQNILWKTARHYWPSAPLEVYRDVIFNVFVAGIWLLWWNTDEQAERQIEDNTSAINIRTGHLHIIRAIIHDGPWATLISS